MAIWNDPKHGAEILSGVSESEKCFSHIVGKFHSDMSCITDGPEVNINDSTV